MAALSPPRELEQHFSPPNKYGNPQPEHSDRIALSGDGVSQQRELEWIRSIVMEELSRQRAAESQHRSRQMGTHLYHENELQNLHNLQPWPINTFASQNPRLIHNPYVATNVLESGERVAGLISAQGPPRRGGVSSSGYLGGLGSLIAGLQPYHEESYPQPPLQPLHTGYTQYAVYTPEHFYSQPPGQLRRRFAPLENQRPETNAQPACLGSQDGNSLSRDGSTPLSSSSASVAQTYQLRPTAQAPVNTDASPLRLSDKLHSTTTIGWITALLAIPMILTLGAACILGFLEDSPNFTPPFPSWFSSAFLYSTNSAFTLGLDTCFTITVTLRERLTMQRRHGHDGHLISSKKKLGSFVMAMLCSAFICLLSVGSIIIAVYSSNGSSFVLGFAGALLSYLIYLGMVIANENEIFERQAHGA